MLGKLATPERVAEQIDGQLRPFIERAPKPDDLSDEEWAEAQERFATKAARAVEEHRKQVAKLEEDAKAHAGDEGVELDTAPAELAPP